MNCDWEPSGFMYEVMPLCAETTPVAVEARGSVQPRLAFKTQIHRERLARD